MEERNDTTEAGTTPPHPEMYYTPPSLGRRIWNRFKDLLFMAVAVLFLRAFVVQAYQIPSGSMENTLLEGDFLIANKFIYGPHIPFTEFKIKGKMPTRGEIVIFRPPMVDKDYIKRVIGLPGDRVAVEDNEVFVNGEYLPEGYIALKGFPPPQANYGPITVPEGHLFVMGDNRNKSSDSRSWGMVDESNVIARAEMIHWSWDKERRRPRLQRIGDMIR